MTGTTIHGSYVSGLTLSNPAYNPVDIASGATIGNVSGAAVLAEAGTTWTIANSGSVVATGAGIVLAGGGTVSNLGSGTVIGYGIGVSLAAAGTVVNLGSIGSTGTTGPAYTYGAGHSFTALSGGVVLGGGGVVSNATLSSISGYFFGIALDDGGAAVNAGDIVATGTTIGFGVILPAGGDLDNEIGGHITGGVDGVVALGSAAVGVSNAGSITGSGRAGVNLLTVGSVSNASTGVIKAIDEAVWLHDGGSAMNAGYVGGGRYGIVLSGSGAVTNAQSGSITVSSIGIAGSGSIASVINDGEIVSSATQSAAGVQLKAGGTVTNGASANIASEYIGVQIGGFTYNGTTYAPGGTVINSGTIFASNGGNIGAAVWIKGNGVILNQPGGTIEGGPYGVVSYDAVTVENFGLISGGKYALDVATAGIGDQVVVGAGAVFSGLVEGSEKGGPNLGVLELASSATAGTISGFDAIYTGFSAVVVDPGGSWALGGTVDAGQTLALGADSTLTLADPAAMGGTIAGFGSGDMLTLAGVTGVTGATFDAGNLLTVSRNGGPALSLQFDPAGHFPEARLDFTTLDGNTELSVAPCFAAGTRILTGSGYVPVEALRAGMRLCRHAGGTAELVWVGHRRIDCHRHRRPQDVLPVRIRAGAFAPGQPAHDLLLSPDHAVFVTEGGPPGVLVPVRYLVNGRTVLQVQATAVTYYHLELPCHDVLIADGLPCESFLDTGNRAAFANAGETAGAIELHADFARRVWQARGCAELVLAGARLAAARQRLLDRAAVLGHATTDDPGLHLQLGRRILWPRRAGDTYRFALPPGSGPARLRSLVHVPSQMRADSDDTRRLGVGVAALALDRRAIDLADPALGEGWHDPEPGWRWTAGNAAILLQGARELTVQVGPPGRYWRASEPELGIAASAFNG